MKGLRTLTIAVSLACAGLLSSPTETLVAGENTATGRQGWHGETMPAGLERGERKGDYLWTKDGSTMVYVPSGKFPMGSEDGEKDEQPVHEVYLDGYYIDKYEVTWGQWKRSGLPYSTQIGTRRRQPEPPDWGIVDEQPLQNVTWDEAKEFVAWAGKRLPTEAEWEKAARGTDGRKYPWGNGEPNFDRAIWKDHPIALDSTGSADCCAAGASPYGAHNMAGNIYEWCEDVYDRNFYANSPERNPVQLEPGRYRVLRGGGFVLEKKELRSALRYRLLPIDRTPYIGFRAALSGVGEDAR